MDDRPPLSAGPEAIAHDLGNALMALLGDVERLSAAADSAIGARALAGVRHCVALCRGMRAGATSTDQAKLQLPLDESIRADRDLLESALEPLGTEAGEGQLVLDLQAPGLEIGWAHTTLRRVLLNLAHNARDAYGDVGGRFEVKTRAAGFAVQVDCIDHAGGIDASIKSAVFRPDFTTKAEGTGLGLAIVQELVASIGGSLELLDTEGEATGRGATGFGTTVRLVLPARPAHDAEDRATAVPGAGQQLLLVEDNAAIRAMLAQELRSNGYAVAEAGDARAAARWLCEATAEAAGPGRDRPLDLLISDVTLPDRSGRDLGSEFREQLGELPVILISAQFNADEPLEVEDERLLKPFEPAELTSVVSRLVRAHS